VLCLSWQRFGLGFKNFLIGGEADMRIACGKCKYYFTTHDVARPWGCQKFGFKSKNLPNQEVKRTTGMDCAYFSSKNVKKSFERHSNGN